MFNVNMIIASLVLVCVEVTYTIMCNDTLLFYNIKQAYMQSGHWSDGLVSDPKKMTMGKILLCYFVFLQ